MTADDSRKFLNKILVIVVSSLLLQILGGGFWTWTLSRDNSKEIIFIKEDVEENEREIKANFWRIDENKDQIVRVENKIDNHIE